MTCPCYACSHGWQVPVVENAMPRRAARVDKNQQDIVSACRDVGASVQSLASLGQGVPDLLVGFRDANFILEVKNPNVPRRDRELTEAERRWKELWRGQYHVVETPEEALRVIGAI